MGILVAVAAYYIIHEGAHALAALSMGVFEHVRFRGIGMRIVANTDVLSNVHLAVFCLVGAVATLICAAVLVLRGI